MTLPIAAFPLLVLAASASTPPADFLDSPAVREAIRKAPEDTLVPGLFAAPLAIRADYPVIGIRRTRVGMSEIHTESADIFYVLEGSGTVTTGGTLVGAREIGPGEIRGTGVGGGSPRRVGPGDVGVVPAGVVHWVSAIEGPELVYLVAKVPALRAPAAGSMPADVGAGRAAWFDLAVKDVPKAREFYSGLFGWTYKAVLGTDLAAEVVSRGASIGTIRQADGAVSPFNGVVYIQVDDLPATLAKTKALGGTVIEGFPFDLPNGTGAIGVILDPSGHPLGLYSRTKLPAAR